MFLIGSIDHRASIVRFDKDNMRVDGLLQVENRFGEAAPASEMNEILSYIEPNREGSVFACGYKWLNPSTMTTS